VAERMRANREALSNKDTTESKRDSSNQVPKNSGVDNNSTPEQHQDQPTGFQSISSSPVSFPTAQSAGRYLSAELSILSQNDKLVQKATNLTEI